MSNEIIGDMKRYAYILLSVAAVFSMLGCKSEKAPKTDLPREVYVGQQASTCRASHTMKRRTVCTCHSRADS